MIVVVILFVATNFYLLLKDDSPVARSVYIGQWTSAKEQNLIETKRTDGVTIPLEEQPVYYDNSKGSFEGFAGPERRRRCTWNIPFLLLYRFLSRSDRTTEVGA